MSSVKLRSPVGSGGSSLRNTLFPMYRRAVSVTPRLLVCGLGGSCRSLQFQEVLTCVHGVLVLYQELRDGPVLLGLDLVEALHHLDQADGVPLRDGRTLLDVELAVGVRAPVEGTGHLRFHGLRQISSSWSSGSPTTLSLATFRWP